MKETVNQVDDGKVFGLRWGINYPEVNAACKRFWAKRGMQEPGISEDLVAHWVAKKAGRK